MSYHYYVGVFETLLIQNTPSSIIFGDTKIEITNTSRRFNIFCPDTLAQPQISLGGNQVQVEADIPLSEVFSIEEVPDNTKKFIIITVRKRRASNPTLDSFLNDYNRAIAFFSILYSSPLLFNKKLFEGYQLPENEAEVSFPCFDIHISSPVIINHETQESMTTMNCTINASTELSNRFNLMSKFYVQATHEENLEAKLIWLWTVLEIFPMKDSTNIALINQYLATFIEINLQTIQARLQIGRGHGIRSDLLHNGKLLLTHQETLDFIKKLQITCTVIMRHMTGLPYQNELNEYFE